MMNCRRHKLGTDTDGQTGVGSVQLRRRVVDDAFLDRTIELFQTRTDRTLTREDAREMIENVTGFFRILGEWNRAEQELRRSDPTAE